LLKILACFDLSSETAFAEGLQSNTYWRSTNPH